MPLLFLLQVKIRMALGCVPTKRWGAAKWRTTARPRGWVAWTEWRRQRPLRGIHTKTPQGHIPTRTPQGQCYTRPRRPHEGHKTCGKHGVGNHHATTSRTSKCLVLIYLDQTYEGVGGRGKPLPGLEGGVFIS